MCGRGCPHVTTWLAYIPSPPRGVWHLGPLPIRAYALFIITGIVVALLIGDRRWAARGGQRGVIYDIALWAVPFGLIGGRLYHLATDWQTYLGPSGAGSGAALRIWDGGLGIWGAVALGGVGAWIGCRRRGIPLPAFVDAIAPGVVLAQAIGRLGNYFNQELYGRETTVPWGLEIFYRRDPGFRRVSSTVHSLDGVSTGQLAFVVQPTFLYELLWNLLVFGALLYLDRRFTLGHGRLFAIYVAGVLRRAILGRAAARRHRHAHRRHPGQYVHIDFRLHRGRGLHHPGAEGPRRPREPAWHWARRQRCARCRAGGRAGACFGGRKPTVAAPAGPGEDDKPVDFSEVAKHEESPEAEVAESEIAEPEVAEPEVPERAASSRA